MIREVGTWKRRPRIRAAKEVDLTYGLITPGLFNLHTHLPMTMLRGIAEDVDFHTWLYDYIFPVESKWVKPDFCQLGTQVALLESIRFGITYVADMYYFSESIGKVIEQMGVRALLGQHVFDPPAPDFANRDLAIEGVRKLAKKYKNHPKIQVSINPHAPYTCSQETLKACAATAKELNIPLMIHLAETAWEVGEIRSKFNMTPVEYISKGNILDVDHVLLPHSVWPSTSDFKLLERPNVTAILNPQCNAKLASGIAPVEEYMKRSIRFAMGTDGAASNNALDIFSELNFLAKIHHVTFKNMTGLPGPQLFSAATRTAAEAVGRAKTLGSLEPGKMADFIVIDLRAPHLTPFTDAYAHLIYAIRGQDVDSTYVGGKPLMKNRKILVADEAKIRAKAEGMWKKIRAHLHSIRRSK